MRRNIWRYRRNSIILTQFEASSFVGPGTFENWIKNGSLWVNLFSWIWPGLPEEAGIGFLLRRVRKSVLMTYQKSCVAWTQFLPDYRAQRRGETCHRRGFQSGPLPRNYSKDAQLRRAKRWENHFRRVDAQTPLLCSLLRNAEEWISGGRAHDLPVLPPDPPYCHRCDWPRIHVSPASRHQLRRNQSSLRSWRSP